MSKHKEQENRKDPDKSQEQMENQEGVTNGESDQLETSLHLELAEAKEKAEEHYAQLQRLKAEFDNYRKRSQKEKEDLAKYASEKITLSMLPVLDNFERAIASAHSNKDFDSFAQGVEMIFRQFSRVLENEGLKAIEAVGQEFDPNLHEALLQEPDNGEENRVLEELEKGYYLKDKVIRPSKVKVSC